MAEICGENNAAAAADVKNVDSVQRRHLIASAF